MRLRDQRRGFRIRILLVAFALVAVVVGVVWLYRSPAFTVKAVDIVGTEHLTTEQVRSLAAVAPGVTLLRLPISQIESRLMGDPWIAAAHVSRDFPDTVRIRVVERTPLACVVLNAKVRWLIDSSGVWLAPQSASATSTKVVVRDLVGIDPVAGSRTKSETLLNALDVISHLDRTMTSVLKVVSAPSIDKTALVTKDDVEVFVGSSDDIRRKLQVAEQILKEQAGKVIYINVRTVDRPTWRGLDSGS